MRQKSNFCTFIKVLAIVLKAHYASEMLSFPFLKKKKSFFFYILFFITVSKQILSCHINELSKFAPFALLAIQVWS
jgi:hypothetical protein